MAQVTKVQHERDMIQVFQRLRIIEAKIEVLYDKVIGRKSPLPTTIERPTFIEE